MMEENMDVSGESAAVRECIAKALYNERGWVLEWDEADTYDRDAFFGMADAVLDALGLEQVGWRCTSLPRLTFSSDERPCQWIHREASGPYPQEPVYRLDASGSRDGSDG